MGSRRRIGERLTRSFGLLVSVAVVAVLATPAHATFPGKNGKIAFSRSINRYPADIWTVNPDGTGATQLTNLGESGGAAWSPDGSRIAFDYAGICGEDYCEGGGLYVMNADGSNVTLVNAGTSGPPLWSPDGTLSPGFPNSIDPAWSPNGSGDLAYAWSIGFGTGFDIIVGHRDGTSTNLTNEPTGSQASNLSPSWSPDGKKIAWERDIDPGPGIQTEIYVMNSDGSGKTNLTNYPGSDEDPVWSPDGTKIAFVTNRDNVFGEIWTMNPDGTGQTKLLPHDATDEDSDLDWQPIPGPSRGDFKNAAKFCKADSDFLGESAFAQKYGANGNGSNAFGKCVGANGS
jgi:TolB protein